ncbi:hypothetical protein WN51_04241 [Melipona quadrifasciata]|uniref:Uncharacterized protein n=1 Tax=Melipona quadrifasciata TaxID=166423 RepID=A0A0M8ZUH2_9HYME|nr:hypothetical protein WN51_04241 [Melipona quadrifasciata]
MNRTERCFLLLMICVLLSNYQVNSDRDARLSRKRRYVVFPEGSTFSVALCLTTHTETPDDDIFTEGINWGISYDLPNESKPALEPFLELRRDEVKPAKKHGHQSTINAIDKNAMKYSGWNGNDKYYVKPGKRKYHKSDYYYLQRRHRRELYSKLETIMNAFPLKRLFSHEPQEHHAYSRAHKAGHEGHDCATMFAGCSFSLIDMALGKYDARRPQLPPEYADTAESFDDWTRYNMK